MENIGLIAAMTQESDALLRLVKEWQPMAVTSLRGNRFLLSGQTCLLVTSGMGARRASEATRRLSETHNLNLIISFGIAGAVEADLEIGDIVLSDSVCRVDGGVPGPLSALQPWPEAAQEAVTLALAARGGHVFRGTAVTTGSSQLKESQRVGLQHPVLEMETAGILQVAAEKGIPLLSLRAISDGPRAPIPLDVSDLMDEDANLLAGRLFKAIIRNPKVIFQSKQILHNLKVAFDNAAISLVAALSHINFG